MSSTSSLNALPSVHLARMVGSTSGRRDSSHGYSSRSQRPMRRSAAVEEAVEAGEEHEDLPLDRQRLILPLLEQLDHARAAGELVLRRLVHVAGELREGGELAILREREAQRAGDLLHRRHLRRAADARHREADVHGRADARVEQVGLEVDLAVGDRDDVGRDVRRDVAGLGLDDRQRRERAGAALVRHLGGALEQARVQVEDVARVRFAARRAAQQERQLAIGDRVLRQVVVHDERVAAVVAPVLADGDAGEGREELQRRRLRRRRGDDDGVVHGAERAQLVDHRGHRRLLLADGDVDAGDAQALLIDDGVVATAVLPVWRSPMMSSRWPRPIGIIESIALRPVCSGSCTDLRATMPGALISTLRIVLVRIGPLPSMGWPSALTTRPTSSSPTGTDAILPVRLT